MVQRLSAKWVIWVGLALTVKVFSFFPHAVERYYSNGIYQGISAVQRFLFGWIPFSIGDIFYFVVIIWLISLTVKLFRRLGRKEMTAASWKRAGGRSLYALLIVYVVFNFTWGLNYNRVPMMQRLGLELQPYSTANLAQLTAQLASHLNNFDTARYRYRPLLNRKRYLFGEARAAYAAVAPGIPFLEYQLSSVKPSIFSYVGNYLGFTGYYNPFSGEAQTNTTVPVFIQPFTTCHEIGHQLGYAKENEANFAGFLSARASSNPSFKYSLYFDLFSYAIRELSLRDSMQVRAIREQLKPNVRADFRELRTFYDRYENPLEPVIRIMYSKYLKANQQPQGLKSYNEVVAMIISYYRRYGHF